MKPKLSHPKLTPEQMQHAKTIEWLLCGPPRSGRTYVLCVVFLEIAAHNLGEKVSLLNNTHGSDSDSAMIAEIKYLFEKHYDTEHYELKVEKLALYPYTICIRKK